MILVLLLASVAEALFTEFSAIHWGGQESFQILKSLGAVASIMGPTFLAAYIFQWLLRRNYQVQTTYTDNLIIAVWSLVLSMTVQAIILTLLYATSLPQIMPASPNVLNIALILATGYQLWLTSHAYQVFPGVSYRRIIVVFFLNIVVFLVLMAGIGIIGAILLALFPQIMYF